MKRQKLRCCSPLPGATIMTHGSWRHLGNDVNQTSLPPLSLKEGSYSELIYSKLKYVFWSYPHWGRGVRIGVFSSPTANGEGFRVGFYLVLPECLQEPDIFHN